MTTAEILARLQTLASTLAIHQLGGTQLSDAIQSLINDLMATPTPGPSPAPTPAPVPAPTLLKITAPGSSFQFEGNVYGISTDRKVTKNGQPLTDPDLTNDVFLLGITTGDTKGSGLPAGRRLVQMNGDADWYSFGGKPHWVKLVGGIATFVSVPTPGGCTPVQIS